MAIGSMNVDYLIFGRVWIISVLEGEKLGRGKGDEFRVLPDGTLTSACVLRRHALTLRFKRSNLLG